LQVFTIVLFKGMEEFRQIKNKLDVLHSIVGDINKLENTIKSFEERRSRKEHSHNNTSSLSSDSMEKILEELMKPDSDLNLSWDAMRELMKLRQTGSISEYHNSFRRISRKLNLPEEVLLNSFLRGLTRDAQIMVRSLKPIKVDTAFMIGKAYETALSSYKKRDCDFTPREIISHIVIYYALLIVSFFIIRFLSLFDE